MMYRCGNCGETFAEPNYYETTYESHYGLGYQFRTGTHLTLELCPSCGMDAVEEIEEKEEDE